MASAGSIKLLTYPKPDVSIAAIGKAMSGPITAKRVSFQYAASLVGVAFTMLMLPIMYLAIVVLVAWGTFVFAVHNAGLLKQGFLGYVFYFIPLFVALPVLLILIRPILARHAKRPETLVLRPEDEPKLFALVAKICESVGVPMPSQIDVDCQPNAGASLKRLFFGRKLALTIGLPLATSLDVRQFSGILAHEFGHFAQGTGMRFMVLIRRITAWLDMIVAQDAEIDATFERNANKRGLTGLLFKAINACIGLVRGILAQLAQAGREVSCAMMRQMEFDADSYEIKLIGSAAFEDTMKRLHLIKIAANDVSVNLGRSWSNKKLPDDLPALVQYRAAGVLAPEGVALLATVFETDTTGRFDTHPSDAARLRAARAMNEPGLFTLEGPASALFSNLEVLCKKATLHEYKHNLGYEFTDENIVTASYFAEKSRYYDIRDEASQTFLGNVAIWFRPIFADVAIGPWSRSAIAPYPRWREAKVLAQRHLKNAEEVSEQCRANEARILELSAAIALLNARIALDAEVFGLQFGKSRKANAQLAAREYEKCKSARGWLSNGLEPFLDATRTRVLRALDLLDAGEAGTFEEMREMSAEAHRLVALCGRLEPHWRKIQDMGPDINAVEALRHFRSRAPDPDEIDSQITEIAARLQDALNGLREALGDVAGLTLEAKPSTDNPGAVIETATAVMKDFTALHVDSMGRLFLIIRDIETLIATEIERLNKEMR